MSTITIIMIIIYYVIILVTQSDLSSSPEPATAQPASAATLSNSTIGSPIVPPVLDEEAKSERLALINHLMQQHRRDQRLFYPLSSDLTFNHEGSQANHGCPCGSKYKIQEMPHASRYHVCI